MLESWKIRGGTRENSGLAVCPGRREKGQGEREAGLIKGRGPAKWNNSRCASNVKRWRRRREKKIHPRQQLLPHHHHVFAGVTQTYLICLADGNKLTKLYLQNHIVASIIRFSKDGLRYLGRRNFCDLLLLQVAQKRLTFPFVNRKWKRKKKVTLMGGDSGAIGIKCEKHDEKYKGVNTESLCLVL